jgi:hypothetical protein
MMRTVEALIEAVECSHEEADTISLFHEAHAEINEYQSVGIRSPKTDSAVIACAFNRHFQTAL